MAETTNKHFIKFSGTKEQFIAKGYPTTYQDKIVFIGNGECIFTRGMYFANFNELITAYVAGMNFLKGVTVDGTSYNAAAGGGYVAFEATDPATVGVNVNQGKITIGLTTAFLNNITNLGTEITNIKKDYATTAAMNTAIGNAKTELKGGTSDTDTSATITGAKKYADKVTEELALRLVGEGSNSEDNSIAGAKAYADKVSGEALEEAKEYAEGQASAAQTAAQGYADTKKSEVIGTANDASSVDTIKGVRKYVEEKTANIASDSRVKEVEDRVKAIEDDYLVEQDKTDLTGLINTEKGRIDTLVGSDTGKSARAIVQDEVAKQLTSENISDSFDTLKEIAEWLSSHPEDVTAMNEAIEANADAIEVLNGADTVEGSVAKTVKDAVNTVRSWVNENYDSKGAAATAESNAKGYADGLAKNYATAAQGALADSAYQKPSTGIPAADLASNSVVTAKITDKNVTKAKLADDVQTSLGYADSALQSVTQGDYITVGTKSGNNGAKTQTVTAKVTTIESATALKQGFADAFDTKRQIEGAVSTAQGYANTAESNAKSYADSQWGWLDLD